MELTDRSDALYAGLDRPWDQAANWLFAARAAVSAGDQERSIDALAHVQHWLTRMMEQRQIPRRARHVALASANSDGRRRDRTAAPGEVRVPTGCGVG
jgi:phosphoglycerate-specific signal transduction histidine kinase